MARIAGGAFRSRWAGLVRAALGLLLAAMPTIALAQYPAPYTEGEGLFDHQRYRDAQTLLRPFYASGGRYAEVAYWVGASLCRDQLARFGRNWLDEALTAYRLKPDQEKVIQIERSRCNDAPGIPPQPMRSTTERYVAELLYYGADARIVAKPITPIAEIPAAEFGARHVKVGDTAKAKVVADRLIAAIEAARGSTPLCGYDRAPVARISGRYMFISRRPFQAPLLDGMATSFDTYVRQLDGKLGLKAPEDMVIVHLTACEADAALTARALAGLRFDPNQVAGFSVSDDQSVIALWDGSAAGGDSQTVRTLRHELFHLIGEKSFPNMPQWLDEGLAQYLGVTAIDPAMGRTTYLAPEWGALPSLRSVLSAGWPRFDAAEGATTGQCVSIGDAMMAADVSRMFLAFLDREPGRLGALVTRLKAMTPDDWPGEGGRVAAVEAVLGRPIEQLERDMLAASIVKNDEETGALFKAQPGGVACPPTAAR
jgi:hypothetical protein